MGNEFPACVMLVPCDVGPPSRFADWHDAYPILVAAAEAPGGFPALHDRGRVWELMSRNFWCQWMIVDAARACGIDTLDFLREEVTLLDAAALGQARTGLAGLLAGLDEEFDIRAVPWLAHVVDTRGHDDHLVPEPVRSAPESMLLAAARQVARPARNLRCTSIGLASLVDFFRFVLSLQEAVQRALAEGECLLYVQPR